MKTKALTFLLFFTLGLLTSCDDSNDAPTQCNTISGVWHLKKVSGGLLGINIDYNIGDVKWTFNATNNTLAVENNILTAGPESIYAGPATGTYPYEVQIDGTTQLLFIDGMQRGQFLIVNNNTLKIDDGIVADGFLTEFVR